MCCRHESYSEGHVYKLPGLFYKSLKMFRLWVLQQNQQQLQFRYYPLLPDGFTMKKSLLTTFK